MNPIVCFLNVFERISFIRFLRNFAYYLKKTHEISLCKRQESFSNCSCNYNRVEVWKIIKVESHFTHFVIIKLLKNVIFNTYQIFEPNCLNNLKERSYIKFINDLVFSSYDKNECWIKFLLHILYYSVMYWYILHP